MNKKNKKNTIQYNTFVLQTKYKKKGYWASCPGKKKMLFHSLDPKLPSLPFEHILDTNLKTQKCSVTVTATDGWVRYISPPALYNKTKRLIKQ